ncbi:M48 family metallopeptidase [Halobaculum halobium]|uniref:M48 family metallopeptidase n=1 Tax=Halobaculum halobium TaxID=3032281 RepID=A0ABD5T7U3_9EURY|nr:M48 family metalloprotease [Halobaculum sp. SYNS20]
MSPSSPSAPTRDPSAGFRAAMAVAGAATLGFYGVAAAVFWRLGQFVWANRPSVFTLAWTFLLATLISGYLTYRFGTGRTLAGLDARELPRERARGVHRVVDDLAAAMNVSRPGVYVARLGEPNALALGGRPPALVVDYSLFRALDAAELRAVLAHELAHIEGRDGLVQTLAHSAVHTAVGVVALALAPLTFLAGGFARGVALARGSPGQWHRTVPGQLHVGLAQVLTLLLVGLTLFLRAYSRRREHAADDRAVEVTGDPLALARALEQIERASRSRIPFAPLYSRREHEHPLARLLATHPPMDERVDRLRRRGAESRAGARGVPRVDNRGGESPGSPSAGDGGLRPGRPNRGDDGWTRISIEER